MPCSEAGLWPQLVYDNRFDRLFAQSHSSDVPMMCREDVSSGLDSWTTSKTLTSATQTWRTWSWMSGLPTSWLRGRTPGEMLLRLPSPMVGAALCAVRHSSCHTAVLHPVNAQLLTSQPPVSATQRCFAAVHLQMHSNRSNLVSLGCTPFAWPQSAWCMLIAGLGTPGMTASLSYFDSIRRARLPANLVQAQRDFFGSHTYERTDKDGWFHTVWDPRNSAESITSAQYNT